MNQVNGHTQYIFTQYPNIFLESGLESIFPSRRCTPPPSLESLCHGESVKLSVSTADGWLPGWRSLDHGRVAWCQSSNQLVIRGAEEALIGIFKIQYRPRMSSAASFALKCPTRHYFNVDRFYYPCLLHCTISKRSNKEVRPEGWDFI